MDTVVDLVSAGIVVASDLKYTKRLCRSRQPSISSVVVLVLLRVETHLCFGQSASQQLSEGQERYRSEKRRAARGDESQAGVEDGDEDEHGMRRPL